MYTETQMRQLYQCFSRMLEYPAGGTLQAALKAYGMLMDESPKAAALLKEFHEYAETLSQGRLEEVYTGTFDLDAACHPYIGYHLFGETYKRSAFMVELKESYKAQGFEMPGNELPDHLAIILRFLAFTEDHALADDLIREALLPVLDRMTGRAKSEGFDEDADSPKAKEVSEKRTQFQVVLEALRSALQDQFQVLKVLEPSA
ncbi:MAG: nitrate reductase molybdenum cofactor assembly chaperone [Chloroflexota bacterium]